MTPKFFLENIKLSLSPTLSGLVVQDTRRKRTAFEMERKIISVDLQQGSTQDRVAGLFLVELSGEAGNWDSHFTKIDLRRQV